VWRRLRGVRIDRNSAVRLVLALGWMPVACILLALALIAGSGISWVTSQPGGINGTNSQVVKIPPNFGPSDVTTTPELVDYLSPNRIAIPKLKASAPIVRIGDANQELEPPLNPRIVGWWDGGAKPGAAIGTAIITGHINYAGVTGVFSDIGDLRPGNLVYVWGIRHGKHVKLTFKVISRHSYYKTVLPYAQLFDQSSVGRLALVTCGGPFDPSTGNYLENIVVYAQPIVPPGTTLAEPGENSASSSSSSSSASSSPSPTPGTSSGSSSGSSSSTSTTTSGSPGDTTTGSGSGSSSSSATG